VSKACNSCRVEKPFSDFYKYKGRSRDGYRRECKACSKAAVDRWRLQNPERARQTMRNAGAKWRAENKENYLAEKRAWAAANPEKVKVSNARWAKENKERRTSAAKRRYQSAPKHFSEIARQWRIANPDRVRATKQRFCQLHPEKVRLTKRLGDGRRRARLKSGSVPISYIRFLESVQKWRCAICPASLRSGYEIDHIQPLCRGGLHIQDNLQLLCADCNRRKGGSDPIQFMQSRGFLL
jgi:5-methylcytosine-specific restriction endonuclease McrA